MGWKRAQRRLIILLRCLLGRGMVEIKAGELQKGLLLELLVHSLSHICGHISTHQIHMEYLLVWLAQNHIWGQK